MRIITNSHERLIVDGYDLNADERAEFDYLDWAGVDEGNWSPSFFRYKGQLHDLGEFSADWGITRGTGLPDFLKGWDGYRSDSFFSALVVRYTDEDHVVVGLALS